MHDREVLHRDIKPTNILVCGSKDPNPVFKMADFGLARQINVPVDGFTKYVGTLSFMSPEMVRGHCYNKSTDIWSLACCAYEVTTGVKVEVDKRGNLLRERSWENWTYSECLKDLLQSMFQLDPEKRPTVDGILVAIETKRHPQETKLHSLETKPDAQTHSRIPRVKKEHLAVENLNLSHSCPAGFLEESDDNEMEDTPRESYFIKQVQVKMSKSNADYLKWAEHCYMSLVDKLHSDIYMDQIEAAINETMDHCSEEVFLEKMKLLLPPKKFKRCEVYLKNYLNYMSALYKTPLMPSFQWRLLEKTLRPI
ncbi:uncharacterized protein LOC127830997 [Dreissena polymorpha]|nr:uncharacterized protein LOC127830997 [Dreissena polymorpha]